VVERWEETKWWNGGGMLNQIILRAGEGPAWNDLRDNNVAINSCIVPQQLSCRRQLLPVWSAETNRQTEAIRFF